MREAERNLPAVQVLLATFNGERYLAAQIDSILAQAGVRVSILASDDGSTDKTRDILLDYQTRFPDVVRVLPSAEPTGSPKWNFLRLLQAAESEYVALADQDDFWLPQKLTRSMQRMRELEQQHGAGAPLLVFSDLEVVDSELHRVHASLWKNQQLDPARIGQLNHLLMQNVLTGCTALVNGRLRRLAWQMPGEAVMHDWWLALVACAFGHAAPLHEATVLYRQHGGNSVGAVIDSASRVLPRLRKHAQRRIQWESAVRQGIAFLRTYCEQLSAEQRKLLKQFALCEQSTSRLVRVSTFLRGGFFFTGLRPNLAMLWYLWDMQAAKRADAEGSGM